MTGRRFVRDSLVIALGQYVSRGMLLARGLATAVAMGPAGFGAWNALNLILDYGAYASLGVFYGLDRRLPPAVARGDESGGRSEMRAAWGLALSGVTLFALLVVVYLAAGMWLAITGWGWGAPLLMLGAALLQVAIHYHATVLRAHGDFGRVGAATTLQAVIGGGIGLATVWRTGVWGLLWGWLVGGIVALAVLRRSPRRPPLSPAGPAEGMALARAGFPLFAFFALSLVIRSVDRIALVRFGGNDALGHYSVGLVASGLVLFPPEAVASVLFPRIAAAAEGARDPARTRAEVTRAQRALTALLPLPVGLGALWAGPVVEHFLPAFGAGIWALRILAIGALVLAAGTLPGYYLLGAGHGRSALVVAAGVGLVSAMAIFGVASNAPHATAVAIAAAAGQGLWAAVMLGRAIGLLVEGAGARRRLWIQSLAPALWSGAWLLGLSAIGPETAAAAAWRSLALIAACAPVTIAFARGLGLRAVLADWRAS